MWSSQLKVQPKPHHIPHIPLRYSPCYAPPLSSHCGPWGPRSVAVSHRRRDPQRTPRLTEEEEVLFSPGAACRLRARLPVSRYHDGVPGGAAGPREDSCAPPTAPAGVGAASSGGRRVDVGGGGGDAGGGGSGWHGRGDGCGGDGRGAGGGGRRDGGGRRAGVVAR